LSHKFTRESKNIGENVVEDFDAAATVRALICFCFILVNFKGSFGEKYLLHTPASNWNQNERLGRQFFD